MYISNVSMKITKEIVKFQIQSQCYPFGHIYVIHLSGTPVYLNIKIKI